MKGGNQWVQRAGCAEVAPREIAGAAPETRFDKATRLGQIVRGSPRDDNRCSVVDRRRMVACPKIQVAVRTSPSVGHEKV